MKLELCRNASSFISDISRIVLRDFKRKYYYKSSELSTENWEHDNTEYWVLQSSTMFLERTNSWLGHVGTSITLLASSRVVFAGFSGHKSLRHLKKFFSKYQTKSFPEVFFSSKNRFYSLTRDTGLGYTI